MGKPRPTGITILVVLEVIGAIGLVLAGIQTMKTVQLVGIVLALFGIVHLALAAGLWNLRAWGYKLATALYTLGIIVGAITITADILLGISSIAINVLILTYLRSKEELFVD